VQAYSDGTRMVPVDELPREYAPPPETRSWAFLVVLIALLLVLAGLLDLLARQLGVGEDKGDDVEQVDVPNVVDAPFDDARTLLEAAGFDVRREDVDVTDPAKVDIVISQDPEFGIRVDKGSTITLRVGAQDLLEVPDLAGSTPDHAVQTLQHLGFTTPPGQTEEASDEVEEGQIIRTDPPAGQQVAANAQINLIVSSGPEQVPVPAVSGCDINAALRVISQAGLTPQQSPEPSNDEDEGCIVRSDPAGGTPGDPDSTVTVVVSSGPSTVTVPSVVGLDQAAAADVLDQNGFEVEVRTRPAQTGETPGDVVDQTPSANAEAEPGSTVTITVAQGGGGSTSSSTSSSVPDVGD
jgi:serine/threonine-protein kinase